MKNIIYFLLTASLTLTCLTFGYTQDADFDPLRASDVNTDGIVNILDLTLVAGSLGKDFVEDQHAKLDVNGDNVLSILDLVLIASHLGRKSGIPFEVTDANFDEIVLGSELPIVVEFKNDT